MSQLVSWSFSALLDVLENNGEIPKGIDSVRDAHEYLKQRGLYQKSLRKRSKSRIVAAMGFENLRAQGLDPACYHQPAYDMVHSKHSIKTVDREIEGSVNKQCGITDEAWEGMQKRIAEEKEKEQQEQIKKEIEKAKSMGIVVI